MSEGHACVVCGRVLERVVQDNRTFFRHASFDEPVDHLPVAVRVDAVPDQVMLRCDFCLADDVTHTMVVDRELSIGNMRWDPEWAMCTMCAKYAMNDDWPNLRRRAFAAFERRFGPMSAEVKEFMTITYQHLRDHLVMFYAEP